MVEVEEIDLDLGLSIGGSFREKPEKPKPEEENQIEHDSRTNEFIDSDLQHAKRDIQVLRREEAKKKRENKKRVRESEPEPEYETVSKREKMDNQNGLNDSTIGWTTPFQVQLAPLNNGYTLPFWVQSENGIPPFLACRSEQNGEIESVNCADRKGKSNGSSICSSSVVSDYQTSSHDDWGSTDSHSHSSHSLAEPTQLNNSQENNITTQLPEPSASSHPMRSEFSNNAEWRNHTVKENLSNITQPKEEATKNSKSIPMPFTKPLLCNENSSNDPLKETKIDIGIKPPKPLTQISSLPQMPYVSTTGIGPNGKTVNGFLYKYSKSEVSIVCVCHGSTFSPSEFVQHAGGTDISHPLRHITVIPFAFG